MGILPEDSLGLPALSPPTIVPRHVLHDVQHDNVMMCVNQVDAHVDAEADCLGTELAII